MRTTTSPKRRRFLSGSRTDSRPNSANATEFASRIQAQMRARFWGTRGSIPTPGPSTVRYGGNTACVEVRDSSGSLLILDAGTGLRELGLALMNGGGPRPLSVDLLLSHPHWEPIQGIPFFRPALDPKTSLRIRGPKQSRALRE